MRRLAWLQTHMLTAALHVVLADPAGALLPALRQSSAPSTAACDGHRLIFVGGYHHGGTTIVQAQLMLALNQTLDEQDERWPDEHLEEACSKNWTVFKHPTNTVKDIERMMRLRSLFPKSTMVFATRDMPNTVWSLMKRYAGSGESPGKEELKPFTLTDQKGLSKAALTLASSWCRANGFWFANQPHGPLDWTLDLGTFTSIHAQTVASILANGATTRGMQLHNGHDSKKEHKDLRDWQLQQAVYPYDHARVYKEAPIEASRLLERLACDGEGEVVTIEEQPEPN